MLESKYESHIENSLSLLISSFRELGKESKIKKQLKEIGHSKRMKKLTQQTKKKRIFELAYEFVSMINS